MGTTAAASMAPCHLDADAPMPMPMPMVKTTAGR